ncbi:MAG: carboxypeptidase-like regulatory domain-containing protein [Bacteroidota bacterium]
MKTKYTIGLFFLLLATVLQAQNKTYPVSGTIISSYYCLGAVVGIADVTVTITGNSKVYQTKTDSNGNFLLPAIENGSYNLIAKYENKSIDLHFIVFNQFIAKNFLIDLKSDIRAFCISYSLEQNLLKNFYPIATSTLSVNIKTSECPSIKKLTQEKTVNYFDGVRLAGINEERIIGKQQLY